MYGAGEAMQRRLAEDGFDLLFVIGGKEWLEGSAYVIAANPNFSLDKQELADVLRLLADSVEGKNRPVDSN